MIRCLLAGTALIALTACTSTTDTGRNPSPTYTRARMVAAAPVTQQPRRPREVSMATKNGVLMPDAASRASGYWTIHGYSPEWRTVIPVKFGVSTVIRLPAGKQFSKDFQGKVDAFDLAGGYSGSRATIGITPKKRGAKGFGTAGDLKVITSSDGLYRFDLVPSGQPVEVVDIVSDSGNLSPAPVVADACNGVFPQGDHTPLVTMTEDGKTPPWAPVEVWADSTKLFARFNRPLPTMPALYAGGEGDQRVNYRVMQGAHDICLITSRRTTEAQFRHGRETIAITVDPMAVKNGEAADPTTGQWRAAAIPPPSPFGVASGGTSVFVLPGQPAPPATALTLQPILPPEAPSVPALAEQPEAPQTKVIPGTVRGI